MLSPEMQKRIDDALRAQTAQRNRAQRAKQKTEKNAVHAKESERCPFCKSREILPQKAGEKCNWMACTNCQATGPAAESENDALKKWNKRA